jgi:hypothetical protein
MIEIIKKTRKITKSCMRMICLHILGYKLCFLGEQSLFYACKVNKIPNSFYKKCKIILQKKVEIYDIIILE